MQTIQDFFEDAERFRELFDDWVTAIFPPAKADHLCFKCESANEFEKMRSWFEGESSFIYQSLIADRRIAIIKLLKPLSTKLGDIWYVELSDQKPDRSQQSGFDHIEIYPNNGRIEDLRAFLESKGMMLQKIVRPHHTTYDGVIKEMGKIRLEEEPLIQKIKREEMREKHGP